VSGAGTGKRLDASCVDEVSERRFADPHVTADLYELDAPLGDQPADESR
jgi:hypothetical protein